MLAQTALCVTLLYTPLAVAQESPRPIELKVAPDGGISWNGVAVDDAIVNERLASMANQQPKPHIHILANRRATYQRIYHLLKMIQPYGFNVGLVGAESAPNSRESNR
jgi:biopolymer transport protein ExbD